jgi:hypothetical protein
MGTMNMDKGLEPAFGCCMEHQQDVTVPLQFMQYAWWSCCSAARLLAMGFLWSVLVAAVVQYCTQMQATDPLA